MMESLTAQMVDNVKNIMAKINIQGGVIAALESGWVNAQIQTNSALVQSNIDNGKRVIVGLNKHISADNQTVPEYLNIDSQKIKNQQIARLIYLKQNRDQLAVRRTLNALTEIAKHKTGNLLEANTQSLVNTVAASRKNRQA